MNVTYREPSRTNPGHEILFGTSSHDPAVFSVKHGYKDASGKTARPGEVPADGDLLQMVEVAIKQRAITPFEVAEVLARALRFLEAS